MASYKGTSPFTDVPEWAEPYVAACYTNGITSGYDAKTYGGSDTVTTGQAAPDAAEGPGLLPVSVPTSALTGWWRPPRTAAPKM